MIRSHAVCGRSGPPQDCRQPRGERPDHHGEKRRRSAWRFSLGRSVPLQWPYRRTGAVIVNSVPVPRTHFTRRPDHAAVSTCLTTPGPRSIGCPEINSLRDTARDDGGEIPRVRGESRARLERALKRKDIDRALPWLVAAATLTEEFGYSDLVLTSRELGSGLIIEAGMKER